jgi:AraC family transcriptional regulator of adaptative response / DNA-3-methyladenine glycosylase II
MAAGLVLAPGERAADSGGGFTHVFPRMTGVAAADRATLAVPRTRQATFAALTSALASGAIDLGPGSDWQQARAALSALPGLGPWSVETIAMRGLGDPDAFTTGDLGVRTAARQLGLPGTPATLTRRSAAWRPWRAYAVQYLWAAGDHAINRIPAGGPSARRPASKAKEGRESA